MKNYVIRDPVIRRLWEQVSSRNREIEATLRLLLPLPVSLSFSKRQDKGVIGTTDSFLSLKLSEVTRRTPARQMRRDTWLKGSPLWFDGIAPSIF